MLLPAAAAPQPRPRASGRRYDPVEAKAVVTTLFAASAVIGVAVQVLPLWPGTDKLAIGAITAGTTLGALVVPCLPRLPYSAAATLTAVGCMAIACGQYAAGPGAGSATLGAVFALALAAAFLFYSTRVLVVQVLLASAAQATALVALGEGRTAPITITVTLGSAVGAGIVARRLADLRAQAEEELEWRATHDGLTGLANRAALIREWHAQPARPGGSVSVLVLDLRGFKQVNDSLGHGCGDTVLVQVARRLAAVAPPALACRLGGDEFAVLLPGVSRGGALEHAHRVSLSLHEAYAVDGVAVAMGATIGVATHDWPGGAMDAGSNPTPGDPARALSALLAAADDAMYHARVLGRPVATAEEASAGTGRIRRHP